MTRRPPSAGLKIRKTAESSVIARCRQSTSARQLSEISTSGSHGVEATDATLLYIVGHRCLAPQDLTVSTLTTELDRQDKRHDVIDR